MNIIRRWISKEACLKGGLISLIIIFMVIGCATAQKEFDPNVKGPQMIVEPETIRLGVATLTKTPIVFRGKGFLPEDSVFISLLGVKKKNKTVDIPVADGDVGKDGNFVAKVGTLAKVGELLRAQIGSNKEMENIIVVTQPPIPEGVYTVKAMSMESDITAESKLTIKGPSILDRIKDWIGGLLGKIEKK